MGIVVLGAVFVDIKGNPFNIFIPNGRNEGMVEHLHGGVARNVVEDIANIELRPTFVSLVDDSAMGDEVITKLKNHKVNTDYMRKTPDGMGTWLAIFNNDGDVYASISKRPNLHPILNILEEQGDEIFKDAESICVEIDMDKDVVKQTFKLAEQYNKPVFGVVSNMSIAVERRDLIKKTDCFVCNVQEAGLLFSDDYTGKTPEEMCEILAQNVALAKIKSMIVTMGGEGAIYATADGQKGICPAKNVNVKDTTGAGDSFFAGVAIGLTYGKDLPSSCEIGSRLAASVICNTENVCPRFLPEELGLDIK